MKNNMWIWFLAGVASVFLVCYPNYFHRRWYTSDCKFYDVQGTNLFIEMGHYTRQTYHSNGMPASLFEIRGSSWTEGGDTQCK